MALNRKSVIFVLGILVLGIVIFNNIIQTAQVIKGNSRLILGLVTAMIGSVTYGIMNMGDKK